MGLDVRRRGGGSLGGIAIVACLAALGCRHASITSVKTERMEGVIAHWRSVDPAEREAASEEARTRWRLWDEPDLAALRHAAQDEDPEVAERARGALRFIEPRLRVGDKVDEVEALLEELHAPGGKLEVTMWDSSFGPSVEWSPPMERLRSMGRPIEPLLVDALDDRDARAEVALVLGSIGGLTAVQALIAAFPEGDDPVAGHWFDYTLFHLTGNSEGGCLELGMVCSDGTGARWRAWIDEFGPYLFDADCPRKLAWTWFEVKVELDVEAMFAGVSHESYRKAHRRVGFEDVAAWKSTQGNESDLRAYCLSLLIEDAWRRGPESNVAIVSLACLDDPRARNGLSLLRKHVGRDDHTKWNLDSADSITEARAKAGQRAPDLDESSVRALIAALAEADPLKRVDAARQLCASGRKEGIPVLLEALELRPLTGPNLDAVRGACEVLGKLGDASAIGPLRRLLNDNLNGSLPGVYGESARYGRPDAVALARLGDEAGFQFLAQTLENGDPWWVQGLGPDDSDIEQLMDRRFLPLLVPLLGSRRTATRHTAARTIILLLDDGR